MGRHKSVKPNPEVQNTQMLTSSPPAPSLSTPLTRIRIAGASGVLFDACPNGKFYTASTFGTGVLLQRCAMTQRIVADDSSASDDDNPHHESGQRKTKEKVISRKATLVLPDVDGGSKVDDGCRYNVVVPAIAQMIKQMLANKRAAEIAALEELKKEDDDNGVQALKTEPEEEEEEDK